MEAVSVVSDNSETTPDVFAPPDDDWEDDEAVVLMDHDDDDAKWLMGFTDNEHR
jgi:hypothetical protein